MSTRCPAAGHPGEQRLSRAARDPDTSGPVPLRPCKRPGQMLRMRESRTAEMLRDMSRAKPASSAIVVRQQVLRDSLPFPGSQDVDGISRGLLCWRTPSFSTLGRLAVVLDPGDEDFAIVTP